MRHSANATPLFVPRRLVVEDRADPRLVERAIEELEPHLAHMAVQIAGYYPTAIDEMIQDARIALCELDLGRFEPGDEAELERLLTNRMMETYRKLLRAERGVRC